MLPVSKLPLRYKSRSLVVLAISGGIGPDKVLFSKYKISRLGRKKNDGGIGPLNLLFERLVKLSFWRLLTSKGISPSRPLSSKKRFSIEGIIEQYDKIFQEKCQEVW